MHDGFKYMAELVECLEERHRGSPPKPQETVNSIYETTQNFLGDFEGHIQRCKKYN